MNQRTWAWHTYKNRVHMTARKRDIVRRGDGRTTAYLRPRSFERTSHTPSFTPASPNVIYRLVDTRPTHVLVRGWHMAGTRLTYDIATPIRLPRCEKTNARRPDDHRHDRHQLTPTPSDTTADMPDFAKSEDRGTVLICCAQTTQHGVMPERPKGAPC